MLKTKPFFKYLLCFAGFLTACAPNAEQLKKAIEEDPSIVFVAIEKHPDKFMEVVQVAAKSAQAKAQEREQAEEQKKRDEEFNTPLKPEIDPARAMKGNLEAKITLVEYSDFQCPYCKRGYETVEEVLKAYPNQIRFVFKHLPLDFHPKAMPAAKYFEAIARQSAEKAYEWHDVIFKNQDQLSTKGEAFMKDAAKQVGANLKDLEKALKDPKLMDRVNADIAEAKKFGIQGTPGFIINGVSLKGAYPFPEFKAIIDKHLANSK